MDNKEEITVSGIDIYGNLVEGQIVGTMDTIRIAAVRFGTDRLDETFISFDNINKIDTKKEL